MYENWKINKSELAEKQTEYAKVAQWCDTHIGYTIQEIGDDYCVVKSPEPTIEERNNQISRTRQYLFTQYADPIKFDYDENRARYGEDDERTIITKQNWLDKKDEIRADNPYLS